MEPTKTVTKTADKKNGTNGGAAKPVLAAVANTLPGTRGRRALDTMTPEELKEWNATHPSFMALVSYDGGKPNLDKSVELFKQAFSAYVAYRPTPVTINAKSSAPAVDSETLKKIEKIAADGFSKRAKVSPTEGGPRRVAQEAFLTFICQSLGIDPFEMEEKRKSILRALFNSLGYERVKVQIVDPKSGKNGEWVPATGKHAALYLASEAVKS